MWVVLNERSYNTWVHKHLSVQKPTFPDFMAARHCALAKGAARNSLLCWSRIPGSAVVCLPVKTCTELVLMFPVLLTRLPTRQPSHILTEIVRIGTAVSKTRIQTQEVVCSPDVAKNTLLSEVYALRLIQPYLHGPMMQKEMLYLLGASTGKSPFPFDN